MALTTCQDCGNQVSTEATACPKCGRPGHDLAGGRFNPATSSTSTNKPRSHIYGWVALIAFLMSNFIPAIIAPLVVLGAFVFAVLEIKQGSRTFGGIMFALCALQAWSVADHFGGLSSSLGLTNSKQIEEATAAKYSTTDLNVPANADQIVEEKCTQQWPNDFEMRRYCQGKQHDGIIALSAGQPASVSHDAFVIIRGKCAQEWPRDFEMREYCETKQYESYSALQANTTGDSERAHCAQKWPDNYEMRQYCERQH